ncbi:MAG: DUF5114 domain-containing protein [Muribaculaceae bacterium]
MKTFKYIVSLLPALLICAMLQSCDKDGDLLYTDGTGSAAINGTDTDIVLDYNNLSALALTIYWNENGDITLSDPRVEAPKGAVTNTIQMSPSSDFASVYEEIMSVGVYARQYTCDELNNILNRLGYEGGVKAPLYIRIKSSLGNNIDPDYSDVLSLNVTPYLIDMSIGYYLDSKQGDTGKSLYSATSNGVYIGFIGAGAWENWWLREGNNTIWGNDGVVGTPFMLGNNTTGLSVWNFWYPGVSGCYYTIVDTKANEWSALLIPELTLGGDLSGAMTYDRKANVWTYVFDASAGTVNVTISGTGKQYNIGTGTDDAAAIDTPVAFSGSADNLSFGSSASSISVPVSASGEATLKLDLSNPCQWTVTVEAGGGAPVVVASKYLYLSGVYGDWNFESYLKLYNEDNLTYGGALQVNSEWGYRMYTEAEAWDNYYTMVDGGNAFEGSLVKNGDGNVAAPDPGFYLFDVSLSGLTYKVTPITKVSYSGLNDDWSLTEMTATETPGVYTAVVQKTANTPWGVKIILNDNWDLFFGGGSGELLLYQSGFDGDNELANGEYTLTVDLSKGTYSYTAN